MAADTERNMLLLYVSDNLSAIELWISSPIETEDLFIKPVSAEVRELLHTFSRHEVTVKLKPKLQPTIMTFKKHPESLNSESQPER